jgi:hypothetical protein
MDKGSEQTWRHHPKCRQVRSERLGCSPCFFWSAIQHRALLLIPHEHLLNICSQKFYKLKKECEQLKAGDRTAGPSTPKAKASGSTKTPGTIRGRKRKDASDEETGRITKRQKRPTAGVAEEDPEENEAPNVENEEQGDADEVAD